MKKYSALRDQQSDQQNDQQSDQENDQENDQQISQKKSYDEPVRKPVYIMKKYYFNARMPILPILFVLLVIAVILLYYYWGKDGNELGTVSKTDSQPSVQKAKEKEETPLPESVPDVSLAKRPLSLAELARAGFPPSQIPQTLLIRFTEESFTVQIEFDGFKSERIKAFDQTGFWESFAHSMEKIKTGVFFHSAAKEADSLPESVKPNIRSILVIDAQTQGIKDSTGKIISEYFSDINVNYYDTKE